MHLAKSYVRNRPHPPEGHGISDTQHTNQPPWHTTLPSRGPAWAPGPSGLCDQPPRDTAWTTSGWQSPHRQGRAPSSLGPATSARLPTAASMQQCKGPLSGQPTQGATLGATPDPTALEVRGECTAGTLGCFLYNTTSLRSGNVTNLPNIEKWRQYISQNEVMEEYVSTVL